MEVYKFLPKVRGGAQRAEGSVVMGELLYYCYSSSKITNLLFLGKAFPANPSLLATDKRRVGQKHKGAPSLQQTWCAQYLRFRFPKLGLEFS